MATTGGEGGEMMGKTEKRREEEGSLEGLGEWLGGRR